MNALPKNILRKLYTKGYIEKPTKNQKEIPRSPLSGTRIGRLFQWQNFLGGIQVDGYTNGSYGGCS